MNILEKFEAKELAKLQDSKTIPAFSPGDTLKVNVKVREGNRERIQAYEGVCISRTGSGINENFTVRKISLGEGVERVFPLWSSRVDSIELMRRGSVRRAKLYYMRDLRGKAARITERTDGHGIEVKEEFTESKTARRKAKQEETKTKRAEARTAQESVMKAKEDAKKAAIAAAEAEAKAAIAAAEAEAKAAADAAAAAAAATAAEGENNA